MRILSAENTQNQMYEITAAGQKNLVLKNESAPGRAAKAGSVKKNDDIEARKARLREAAEGFEAIFARQILKTMRSSLSDGGMFGSGSTGEIYSDMMDNAVAEKIAKRGELGLADAIYKQMVKSIVPDTISVSPGKIENSIKDIVIK